MIFNPDKMSLHEMRLNSHEMSLCKMRLNNPHEMRFNPCEMHRSCIDHIAWVKSLF